MAAKAALAFSHSGGGPLLGGGGGATLGGGGGASPGGGGGASPGGAISLAVAMVTDSETACNRHYILAILLAHQKIRDIGYPIKEGPQPFVDCQDFVNAQWAMRAINVTQVSHTFTTDRAKVLGRSRAVKNTIC